MKLFQKSLPSSSATRTTDTPYTSRALKKYRQPRNWAVWIGRLVFLFCLGLAATFLGLISFRLLTRSEKDLAESQFEAIADRALDAAYQITNKKRLGTVTMATIASNVNPDADSWPFVTIRGYEKITTSLIETSSGREMGFAPLVKPEELTDFENFAYEYYFESREPPFPNNTAVSSFGRGVWGMNPALNTSDNRYHESDGSTNYNSPNKIFAPILQHNAGPHKALMLNLHFHETRGVIIDNIIACADKRKKAANPDMVCGAITDFLILTSQEFRPGPGALLIQPIYPARSPYELTGILASSIIWDEVLTDIFTSSVSGVDCIVTTSGGANTYRITDGHVEVKGEGDLHDTENAEYCRSTNLIEPGFFSDDSVSYRLTICPSNDFFGIYGTKNPLIATIGSVFIILFSAFVFFLYDNCVRKEFNARQSLLDAKRSFVRFVSHEVRTPLNSVCMGLTLLQDEMEKVMKTKAKADSPHYQTQPQSNDEPQPIRENGVEEWRSLINEILDNAQSSVDVLNDLLNYDKIEMGTFNLELEQVSLSNLVEKTVNEFKLPASNKRLRLSYHIGDTDNGDMNTPSISAADICRAVSIADPFRLSQVIRNLVSNAIKFTPEGGEILVQVTGEPPEQTKPPEITKLHNGKIVKIQQAGRIKLEVTDSGAGMSPDQVRKTFQQGIQFNRNKLQNGQGSGLGLFIAKGIAEQHHGSLHVCSPGLGQGTTFILSLPIYHVIDGVDERFDFTNDVSVHEIVAESNMITRNTKDTVPPTSLRVLVVDDSATNRRLLVRWLHNRGHSCHEACDGVEAVEMVRRSLSDQEPYDTILMDYEMPRLNGPKACKEIRAAGSDSFIVGISGNVLADDVANFRDHGANAVLPKPVQFPELESLWSEYGFSSGDGDFPV